MRRTLFLSTLAAATLVAGCVVAEHRPTAPHDHHAGTAVRSGLVNDPARVDTGGGRLPDLVVDYAATAQHWVVRQENLPATYCSVQEGGVTPGSRRIIRFTVTTPNIGDADVFVGSPLDHADPNHDGDFSDNDGMFEFASCHAHFHFQNYAVYRLIDANTGYVWKSAKKGFCMLDTDPNPAWQGIAPAGSKNYQSCGTLTRPGFQGVSYGWADTYVFSLAGQYFVLDDPNEMVPPGKYVLRITVNPGFAPVAGQPCPVLDPAGKCHNFAESNYANNVGQVTIDIPADRNGKTGGAVKTAEDAIDDEQRPTN